MKTCATCVKWSPKNAGPHPVAQEAGYWGGQVKRSTALFLLAAIYSAPYMSKGVVLVCAGIALGAAIFYSGRGE